MPTTLPRIALTTGEPAGIGPDICLAFAQSAHSVEIVALGDLELLAARARQLRLDFSLDDYAPAQRSAHIARHLKVLPITLGSPVTAGKLNSANARYVLALLDRAVTGCLNGEFDALVTAPVHKGVINEAGIAFTGHTEYLAERCHSPPPVMLLATDNLRVALATTHLPLKDVPHAITPVSLTHTLRMLHAELRSKFGVANPRILVLGLNPHAGEGGHLGREEIEVIAPVCEALRAQGMRLTGPVAADTAFSPQRLQNVDAVLAMYHDQGLPVLKYAGFGHAVNVTLGLPIIRTSVDHGTALELAGSGRAEHSSLDAAVEMASAIIRKAKAGN